MENFKIIIYSLIQGITEFLPVSSSAHLYLAQGLFNWKESLLLFALGAHLGTLLAVMFHQRKVFSEINFKEKDNKLSLKNNILILALIASIPVITVGAIVVLFFKIDFKTNLLIIALASIFGGILLEIADNFFSKDNKNKMTIQKSLLVGIFQVLAIIPGMSRSGTIITAMRFLGMNRSFSINFSLLCGIPVLIIACSYGFLEIILNYNMYIIKFFLIILFSFGSALVTINFFLAWVNKFSFRVFSIYRICLGVFLLAYLYV